MSVILTPDDMRRLLDAWYGTPRITPHMVE